MIRIKMDDLKRGLARYLDRVQHGETIVVCERNIPIAEIRPVPRRRTSKRPIGLAKGQFKVPASFFEPLSPELLDGFDGQKS